jgi:hypothetical protein
MYNLIYIFRRNEIKLIDRMEIIYTFFLKIIIIIIKNETK